MDLVTRKSSRSSGVRNRSMHEEASCKLRIFCIEAEGVTQAVTKDAHSDFHLSYSHKHKTYFLVTRLIFVMYFFFLFVIFNDYKACYTFFSDVI